jgi:hypothetical protein
MGIVPTGRRHPNDPTRGNCGNGLLRRGGLDTLLPDDAGISTHLCGILVGAGVDAAENL